MASNVLSLRHRQAALPRLATRLAVAGVLLVACPGLALGQTTGRGSVRVGAGSAWGQGIERAVVNVFGGFGLAIVRPRTDEPVDGEHRIEAIAEVGWIENVLPADIDQDIDEAAIRLSALLGSPVSYEAKSSASYWLAGLRDKYFTGRRVGPSLGVGFGWARMTPDAVAEASGMNVTGQLRDEVGYERKGAFLLLFDLGASIGLGTAFSVDVGGRLSTFIRTGEGKESALTGQIYAAAVIGF